MGTSAGCTQRDMYRPAILTYSPSSLASNPPSKLVYCFSSLSLLPRLSAAAAAVPRSFTTATPPRNSKSGPGTRHYSNDGTNSEPPSPVSLQCIGVFALACRSICMVKFSAQGAFDRSCLLCSFCSISSKTNLREKRQELLIATRLHVNIFHVAVVPLPPQ